MDETEFLWRGDVSNPKLNLLHAEAFEHAVYDDDWARQLNRHSLGWVTATAASGRLVGFLNVIWDGGVHAWLQDVIVAPDHRRRGIGSRMVGLAANQSREAGCEWLHVDFDEEHRDFYFGAAGFEPTDAGLIRLRVEPGDTRHSNI